MKRQWSSVILLLLLIMPLLGTWCWLQFKREMVRKEVKSELINGINKEKLIVLKFSTPETKRLLKWQHQDEFSYRGKMYDVVHRQAENDSITFWCWPDHQETRLNQRLDLLILQAMQQDPLKNERQKHLDNFLKTLFSQKVPKDIFPEFDDKIPAGIPDDHIYHSFIADPPSPPPRSV